MRRPRLPHYPDQISGLIITFITTTQELFSRLEEYRNAVGSGRSQTYNFSARPDATALRY